LFSSLFRAITMSTTYPNTQLFIDNQWREATGGKSLPVINPASGKEIGRVAHASIADMDAALLAAQKGFEAWKVISALERSKVMRKAAGLLRERTDSIAWLMTQEQGKPLAEAKIEVMAAADIVEYFAEEGRRVFGRIVSPRAWNVQQQVLKEPVGVVAAFTPWNFPINQVVRKLSAALATGCSMIVKAPEETPASPAELIRAFIDAGVPAGTVGLLYGNPAEISSYLIAHPIVRKITFTGSTPVGKQLAAMAGQYMKRATMELGGHAPVIIAEDADIALAAKMMGGAKFRNAGQVCISPTRFLVQNSVKAEFTQALLAMTGKVKVGDGMAEGTTMGPLANSRRLAAMKQITERTVQAGATVAVGGEQVGTSGNFFAPTIFTDVPLDADIFNNEPFGPMLGIRGFDTVEQMVAEANRLPLGLSSYAFTRSLKHAHYITHNIQAGMLWINQAAAPVPEIPFGGIKDSGYGSEGGSEALEAYLNTKTAVTTML
jgi:succinate-semialdehyde dehydrogenase / glutarate-semialdehyde dehydrogenase